MPRCSSAMTFSATNLAAGSLIFKCRASARACIPTNHVPARGQCWQLRDKLVICLNSLALPRGLEPLFSP